MTTINMIYIFFTFTLHYYCQVSFNLKVIMYISKITLNILTELSDHATLRFCVANKIFDTECVLHPNVRCRLKTIPL